MKLVNLTKQPLLLYATNGALVELPPDPRHLGVVALGEHRTITTADGAAFSMQVRTVREIKGMPEPDAESIYIVPAEVAMVLQQQRADVVFPGAVEAVEAADGGVQHITHLRRVVSGLT